jgi:hypothetical protein
LNKNTVNIDDAPLEVFDFHVEGDGVEGNDNGEEIDVEEVFGDYQPTK